MIASQQDSSTSEMAISLNMINKLMKHQITSWIALWEQWKVVGATIRIPY